MLKAIQSLILLLIAVILFIIGWRDHELFGMGLGIVTALFGLVHMTMAEN